MSAVGKAKRAWENLTVAERRSVLKALGEAMSKKTSQWQEIPIEALVHIPDFDSLPSDLCGHLLISLTTRGFSSEKFTRFFERLGR